jgi:hypothetical protein
MDNPRIFIPTDRAGAPALMYLPDDAPTVDIARSLAHLAPTLNNHTGAVEIPRDSVPEVADVLHRCGYREIVLSYGLSELHPDHSRVLTRPAGSAALANDVIDYTAKSDRQLYEEARRAERQAAEAERVPH